MDKTKAQFEAILEKYQLTKEENWKPLFNWVKLAPYNLQKPVEKGEALKDIDSEELIRLIMLIDASPEIKVQGSAGSLEVKDKALLKYILLSLHKLLQLRFSLDRPNDKDLEEGVITLLGAGSDDYIRIGIKKELEDEKNFIQPYNEDELEDLLGMVMGVKRYESIKKGRGKNIAFLGDKVAEVLASIPKRVIAGLSKTDLSLFVGDIMEWAGFLDDVPKWRERSEELKRCERLGYTTGDVRKQMAHMLKDWLKEAKKVFIKTEIGERCKDCKEFEKCRGKQLKYYDMLEISKNMS